MQEWERLSHYYNQHGSLEFVLNLNNGIPGTGAGMNNLAGLNSVVGPGKLGRRLLGSMAGPFELCPDGLRTSTYFLAENKKIW